jgi:hypothetical protein
MARLPSMPVMLRCQVQVLPALVEVLIQEGVSPVSL